MNVHIVFVHAPPYKKCDCDRKAVLWARASGEKHPPLKFCCTDPDCKERAKRQAEIAIKNRKNNKP